MVRDGGWGQRMTHSAASILLLCCKAVFSLCVICYHPFACSFTKSDWNPLRRVPCQPQSPAPPLLLSLLHLLLSPHSYSFVHHCALYILVAAHYPSGLIPVCPPPSAPPKLNPGCIRSSFLRFSINLPSIRAPSHARVHSLPLPSVLSTWKKVAWEDATPLLTRVGF